MRITRYTDYSLRVLIYLGLKGETLSTIKEIAARYDISKNHLMKVVHDLQQRGYVETLRGKNGGLRLKRAPEDVCIGTLVRATEEASALVECFGEKNACVITPECELKFMLHEALQAFYGVLDCYTLADLVTPRRRPGLERLLCIGDVPVKVGA